MVPLTLLDSMLLFLDYLSHTATIAKHELVEEVGVEHDVLGDELTHQVAD
jgi:hypothetical protein